jgi:hypothetical protein
MKRVRFGLLLPVVAIALQLAWYAVLMVSYVRTTGKLEGADFLMYYSVGRVAREYGLNRVYDLELEAAAQTKTAGIPLGSQQILPPNHPPFLFPLLGLLAGLDYRTAYLFFALLLAVFCLAGLPALYRILQQNGWSHTQAWVALVGVSLFEPLFMSVLKGQDSALLLLGGLLWFSGLTRNNDRLAGFGLSLTLIRPQVAIVLAVPFLFRRRKVFGWFYVGAAALGFYSFLQVGWMGAQDYLHILTISARGEGFGLNQEAMINLTGLLLRIAPRLDFGLVHAIGWGFFAATLVGLCVLWGQSKTIGYSHISLAVCLSLLAAPHLHYHDLALLAVPLVGLGIAGVAAGRLTVSRAATFPMVASVILLFSEFWDPARFTVPYLLMVGLPVAAWMVEHAKKKD